MKPLRILLTGLLVGGVLVFSTGCGEEEQAETQEEQIATVQTGDLSLDISAVGNLTLSEKETLNFELAGTVTEVLVEEGDTVEEGEILARLDTSDRDEHIKALEREIELQDQALLQAEINHRNGEEALSSINSQAYVDQKTAQADLEVANAKISLASAESAFEAAEAAYEANWTIPERIRNYEQKTAQLEIARINLAEAEENRANVISDIELEREIKEKELVILGSKLEDAQKEYDDAVQDLEDAQQQSWNIVAPFTGYITTVSIKEGQDIQKSTAAVEIANPDEFEADVFVNEIDIANVAIGSTATIQIDAMQSMILPAQVIKISPTATIQSGVVNYSVKVKITAAAIQAMTSGNMTGNVFQQAAAALEDGELPPMLQQAVDEGRMTQEQAEAMAEQMQSGGFSGRTGLLDGSGNTTMPFSTPPTIDSEDGTFAVPDEAAFGGQFGAGSFAAGSYSTGSGFQLREGLTVTVSILTESRTGVLLVPSAAITSSGGLSYVTIVNADGTREQRQITAGLSDWQNTEVLSGLEEGEQVTYIPETTTTTDFQGGVFFGSGIMGGARDR